MSKKRPEIKLEPANKVTLLPHGFWDILLYRYLPVLGLTYVSSVIGIAYNRGPLLETLLRDEVPYEMAIFVAFWVSVPAILWILLNRTADYHHVADDWYKIVAGIMTFTLMLSFVLFPEMNAIGLRTYFVATIPVLIVQYFFFVKGGLPAFAAHFLSVLGFLFLLYGALAAVLY